MPVYHFIYIISFHLHDWQRRICIVHLQHHPPSFPAKWHAVKMKIPQTLMSASERKRWRL
jgi:hypothetical protein